MNKTTKSLLGISAFAFLIRIVILANSSLTFYSDDAIYASLARFLLEGDLAHFFHPTWQPLYPAISAIAYKLVGSWEPALQLVSILSGVALVIPLFILLRKFLSTAHALAFAATITFFAPIFKVSMFPMSDMLATLLVLSGITAATASLFTPLHISVKTKLLVLSSFFFGLAYLTRSEGSMFFFLTLGWVTFFLIHQILKKRAQTRSLLVPRSGVKLGLLLPALLVTFFLTISPYLIATKTQLGSWSLSHKFSAQVKQGHSFQLRENGTTWIQEVVSVRSPNYDSAYFRGGIGHLMEYQDWFAWWFQQKFRSWVNLFKNLFPVWTLPLMFLGLLWGLRKLPWAVGYLTFIMSLAIPLTIFSTPLVDPRYLLWAFPLFLLFFWLGLEFLWTKILNKKSSAALALLLSLTLPSFGRDAIAHPLVYAQQATIAYERPEIKKAGEWIREYSSKEIPRIAMRHEGVEFYANAETLYIPQVPYDVFIEYAKENEVDYIVAWVEELAAEPELAKLLKESPDVPQLKEEARLEENNRVLVIYSLRD